MTIEPGQPLQNGRYRIEKILGQGGMGTVYLAADRNLVGRLVAIKENTDIASRTQQQFQREAVLLARLAHPNLPRVTDYFIEPSGRQYLVMDYIEGDDLREIMQKQGGALPEAVVLEWIEQVMKALDYMHNWIDPTTQQPSPIIHRDIKPGNIKRTPNGQTVLVDFGLAKFAVDLATMTRMRGVTPGYSPTEQYTGGTDIRSDIYALGATLYAMLTGRKPPDSPKIAANGTFPAPRQLNPKISRNSERVVLRAMQLQAADRYATVAEMYNALLHKRLSDPSYVLQGKTQHTLDPVMQAPDNRRSWMFWPNRLAWAAISAAFVVLITVVMLMQGFNIPPAPPATPTHVSPTSTTVQVAANALTATLSAVLTANAIDTPDATATATRTATPTLPPTSLPTSTSTVTSVATDTPPPTSPPPTATRLPTSTPRPRSTPLSATSTPQSPTASPTRVSPPATATQANSNVSVNLISPADGESGQGRQVFAWQANAPLAAEQAFEVVFWRQGQEPLRDSFGIIGPTTAQGVTVNLNGLYDAGILARGEYQWGILLVKVEPYTRLRVLTNGHRFLFEPSSGGGDGGPAPSPTPR